MIFLKIIHVVSLSLFWAAFSVSQTVLKVQRLYGKPRGATVRGERVNQLHIFTCVTLFKVFIWKLGFSKLSPESCLFPKWSMKVVFFPKWSLKVLFIGVNNWKCRFSLKTAELWMRRQTRASTAVAFFDVIIKLFVKYTGCTRKMHHSNLYPISLLEVIFFFFTCALNSKFWARFIETFQQCPFWILTALKTQKTHA